MPTTTKQRGSHTIRPAGLLAAAALAALALVLAGCGSGTDEVSAASRTAGTGPDVGTGKTDVGTVLVDRAGRTLYAFAADSKGHSSCTSSCAASWPPVKAGAGVASQAEDVTATLGTTERPDGSTQLTANGWPMYTYAGDDGPGRASGQGLDQSGGRWWVVDAAGDWVNKAAPAGNRGGYGY